MILHHCIHIASMAQKGDIYHQDMPQKCLREVFGLGLFETMSVGCQQSHKDESKFDIDLQVKERPPKTGDIDMEWAIAPTSSGRAGLASIIPGNHTPPGLPIDSMNVTCKLRFSKFATCGAGLGLDRTRRGIKMSSPQANSRIDLY